MPLYNRKVRISANDIEAGMLIEFRYVKVNGEMDTYIVLVIDPAKESKTSSQTHLHGFTIKDMPDDDILNLIEEVGQYDLNTDEAYKRFISSRYVKARPYRTFILDNMSRINNLISVPAEE